MDNQAQSNGTKLKLWNPNAAVNWSILLSPAFGAILHALNWRALGKVEKAKASFIWAGAFLLFLAICLVLPLHGLCLVFLIAWYFIAARPHAKYVKETVGDDYEHKPWGAPIGIAVAGFVGYVILAVIVEVIISAIRGEL